MREALSELSTSSRRSSINHSLNRKISNQIFSILFGLLLLGGILTVVFVYGFRYLLGENPQLSDLSSVKISQKTDWSKNKVFSFFSNKPVFSKKSDQGKILDYALPKGLTTVIMCKTCSFYNTKNDYQDALVVILEQLVFCELFRIG